MVAKSLPCFALLDLIAQQTQSTRQMVFNLPYLLLQTAERPQFDLLLGKPMPTGGGAVFYQKFRAVRLTPAASCSGWWTRPSDSPVPATGPARWATSCRVNLEIDVGLHRGGFADAQASKKTLSIAEIRGPCWVLGNDGIRPACHGNPDLPGARSAAAAASRQRKVYDNYKAQALAALPAAREQAAALTWNAAGSPPSHVRRPGAANGSAWARPSSTGRIRSAASGCL